MQPSLTNLSSTSNTNVKLNDPIMHSYPSINYPNSSNNNEMIIPTANSNIDNINNNNSNNNSFNNTNQLNYSLTNLITSQPPQTQNIDYNSISPFDTLATVAAQSAHLNNQDIQYTAANTQAQVNFVVSVVFSV